MNYEYVWTVLENLILELRTKGVTIPQELVNDLKSAQTFIKIYGTEPTAVEIGTEIAMYMDKLEANLVYLAESDIGEKYADECMSRISKARIKGLREKTTVKTRFASGVPKGDHWIRIDTSDLINEEEIDTLIEKFKLSRKAQENGYLLVHGKEKNVKALIKEIGKKIGKKKS